MEPVDFRIKRDGDCYHMERLWGEAKVLNSRDDSMPIPEQIERRVCPDGDAGDVRIWDAARRVFDLVRSHAIRKISASGNARSTSKSTGHLDFVIGTSVTVERDPDSDDGRDLAVVRLDLPAFLDSGEKVDDCDVEIRFDLDARQPDSQICDAIILLADWMVEETARQTKSSQSG